MDIYAEQNYEKGTKFCSSCRVIGNTFQTRSDIMCHKPLRFLLRDLPQGMSMKAGSNKDPRRTIVKTIAASSKPI